MTLPIDAREREQALDPQHSFIVQAPAGSGKTELLVQRFLTLLAYVKQPEEILAITFTRKAANEMRSRILDMLKNAEQQISHENPHQQKTLSLATAALRQDKKQHWNLLNNPNRLQILTIDAFCLSLTRKMPMLSHFGAQPDIVENSTDYYIKAARNLLTTLETEQPWSIALQQLLLHLDNDHQRAEKLFIDMLSHRDQWLPHILNTKNLETLKETLEQGFKNVILENMENCYQEFPKILQNELTILINYAANNLNEKSRKTLLKNCNNMTAFPDPILENFKYWQGIADLLLTKDFTWQKKIDATTGFPPENNSMKLRMQNLLSAINTSETLRMMLQEILESPLPSYTENQWQIVKALVEILPILAAQLTMIFRSHALVDFIEISSSAIKALGEIHSPSDLALQLDYQIQHILVDEFQDTSLTQFHLLELLTAGWQANDGRTLFLVGDPMQSIYRFRQAEVGLFLRAKQYGIGQIKLKSLTLHANFRSQETIIHWINQTFKKLFPTQENIADGAVIFNESVAMRPTEIKTAINILPFINADIKTQAEKIKDIILDIHNKNPNESIAILVRSRTHLQEILPILKMANIKFHGVEIEKLSEQPMVQDLYALTRALLHLADRIAWLAILRAPWCGLTLTDLYVIANFKHDQILWETLLQFSIIENLSADGKIRIQRILPALNFNLQNRQRQNLRQWVESTWRALGGPACCQHENELLYAENYFKLLEESIDDEMEDLVWLDKKLENIFAPTDFSDEKNIQIMTIHKAKGLEFDHVILPNLEGFPPPDTHKLLLWLERPRRREGSDLLLAPIKSSFEKTNEIYKYLKREEAQKADYEMTRLFYVAVTRAKKTLHLIGNCKLENDKSELSPPNKNSFLHLLWPVAEQQFCSAIKLKTNNELNNTDEKLPQKIRRLKNDWRSPLIFIDVSKISEASLINKVSMQQSLDIVARTCGIIIHKTLQKISFEGLSNWQAKNINLQHNLWKKQLTQAGISYQFFDDSLHFIEQAIHKTIHDTRGQWILDNHPDAQSEFSLTTVQNEKIIHLIIDRTFIFEGKRWIIDYKTAQPDKDESVENFLNRQKILYESQLNSYAQAMAKYQHLPIQLGLYFPLFGGWIEMNYEPLEIEDIKNAN